MGKHNSRRSGFATEPGETEPGEIEPGEIENLQFPIANIPLKSQAVSMAHGKSTIENLFSISERLG
jgi:hypothetical protein